MEEILNLIEKYIEVSDTFWGDEQILDDDFKFDETTIQWMKREWSLLEEMDCLKREILKLIKNDKELFTKYLCLGSCLKTEEYEQAEIFKNEILEYNKI